jgi:hypothetical protein
MRVRPIRISIRRRQSNGLCFQYDHDGHPLCCGISDVALRDLIDFHRFNGSQEKARRALLRSNASRTQNATQRFEENGWLVIWPLDLLRYGYQGQDRSAA